MSHINHGTTSDAPFDVVQIQERRAHRMGRCLYGAVSVWCGGGMAEGERERHGRGCHGSGHGCGEFCLQPQLATIGHKGPQFWPQWPQWPQLPQLATIDHKKQRVYVCVYVGTNTWFFGGKGGIYFRAPFSQKIFLFLVSSCADDGYYGGMNCSNLSHRNQYVRRSNY